MLASARLSCILLQSKRECVAYVESMSNFFEVQPLTIEAENLMLRTTGRCDLERPLASHLYAAFKTTLSADYFFNRNISSFAVCFG